MPGPVSPSEVALKRIPEEVFEAFNEAIFEGNGHVRQDAVVSRILAKMPHVQRQEIFQRGWLDIEEEYRRLGWKVDYDKPGYNEMYEAYYVFTGPKK